MKQDEHLANNQEEKIRCGDNGIFKGVPLTTEEKMLSEIARHIYSFNNNDGKYILANRKLIACQSNIDSKSLIDIIMRKCELEDLPIDEIYVNPLGDWTGGINVDSGATNRKLGE